MRRAKLIRVVNIRFLFFKKQKTNKNPHLSIKRTAVSFAPIVGRCCADRARSKPTTHLRPRVRRRRQQLNATVARPSAAETRGHAVGSDRMVPADRPAASTRPYPGLGAIAHDRRPNV